MISAMHRAPIRLLAYCLMPHHLGHGCVEWMVSEQHNP